MSTEKIIRTVYAPYKSEKIIEKSRFITYSQHVEGEIEAHSFLQQIRSRHSLATHVCYAYIGDKTGNLQRFSDDGEPQGTAGIPMLEVLKNRKLYETAVAVVRYFGGIKLGTGGLVRAYSSAVSENLDLADIRSIYLCQAYQILVAYPEVDRLQKFISTHTCTTLSQNFGEKVEYKIAVKKQDEAPFIKGLIDTMQGKIILQKGEEYYFAFKE